MIAKKILKAIEDAEWDEWLAQPEISQMIDEFVEEAKAEHLAGKTIKYVLGKSLESYFSNTLMNGKGGTK